MKLGRCPIHKRQAIVVEAERHSEFETALTILMQREKPSGFGDEDVDWRLPGVSDWWWSEIDFANDSTTKPLPPHRVFDFLHTHYRGHHRWRTVVGKTGMKRKNRRDWPRVRWIAVQFNGDNDLLHFRLNWSAG